MKNKFLIELDLDVIHVPGYGTLRVDRAEFKVREYLDKMIEFWEEGKFSEINHLLDSSVLRALLDALEQYHAKSIE